MPHCSAMPWTPVDIPGEIWADVPGYESKYWISTHARVFGKTHPRPRGNLIRPTFSGGYPGFSVYDKETGKQRRLTIHVIVALVFIGPRPPGQDVCHNDGNHANSALSNLRYDTPAGNNQDIVKHGHSKNRNKTHCVNDHEYTPENTGYTKGTNWRYCKTCRRASNREVTERRQRERG